jgi:hypothetical protein
VNGDVTESSRATAITTYTYVPEASGYYTFNSTASGALFILDSSYNWLSYNYMSVSVQAYLVRGTAYTIAASISSRRALQSERRPTRRGGKRRDKQHLISSVVKPAQNLYTAKIRLL